MEVPEPSGDGVRVSISAAGVCGSDLHLIEAVPLAFTLGHEFAGRLDDGRLVAVEPLAACRACEHCLAGRPYLCRTGLRMLGSAVDGGMAERCLVPEASIVLLPSGIDAADASLVEPIAVSVHAVRQAGDLAGCSVAVIGGGTIGLTLVAALRAMGAEHVDVFARHEHQRTAAERLGGTVVAEERKRWHVVFDAAGTEASLAQAVQATRSGGRVVLVGVYWTNTVAMPGMEVGMREISLVPSMMYGVRNGSRDFDVAADILARSPELASTLITHRFPLDAATEAFAAARDRSSGAIKVILEP